MQITDQSDPVISIMLYDNNGTIRLDLRLVWWSNQPLHAPIHDTNCKLIGSNHLYVYFLKHK